MTAHHTHAALAAGTALLATVSNADVLYVDHAATGAGNGSTWTDAYTNPGAALAAVQDGDEIWIAHGRYVPPATGWALLDSVSIYGGFTAGATSVDDRDPINTPTVLDADTNNDDGPDFTNRGDNAERVLTVDAPGAAVTLAGLVVRNGDGWSAIEAVAAETVLVEGCLFRENRRTEGATIVTGGIPLVYGGGVWFTSGVINAAVIDCVFEDNRTFNTEIDPDSGFHTAGGGAAFASFADETVIDGSVFRRNTAEHGNSAAGGAVAMFTSTVSIRGCEFTGSEAVGIFGAGGAVHVQGKIDGSTVAQSVVLVDTRFENNESRGFGFAYGGAARIRAQNQIIARCGFIGNTTGFEPSGANNAPLGGGLLLDQVESLNMVNCRLLGNDASNGLGGGLCLLVTGDDAESVRIDGGLVAGNRAARAGGVFIGREGIGGVGGTIAGSTIAFNSATTPDGTCFDGAGVVVSGDGTGDVRVLNTILWGNDLDGVTDEPAQVTACFPVVSVRRCLVEGWTGSLGGVGNAGDDPLFTDPDGEDGILGTDDDKYSLNRFSPAIDAGSNSLLPADTLDLDDDGITAETLSLDVAGRDRRVDDVDVADTGVGSAPVVDIGAIEFQRRSCPADLNTDGLLDLADITLFVSGFPAQSPETDLNGDGLWDLTDINIFVGLFTAGCP